MKNIFKLSVVAGIVFVSNFAFSQQAPLYSQYINNDFVINPAIAGSRGNTELRTVVRSQWMGVEGQPNTQTFSAHGAVGKSVGLGGFVFNDKIGPISKTGVSGSYAYHLNFANESKLSFGVSGMVYLYSLRVSELKFDDGGNTDNVVSNNVFKAYYPNFSFGVNYKTKNWFVGLSVPELMQTRVSSTKDFYIMKEIRHYYLAGGYTHKFSESFSVTPSVLFKYVKAAPTSVDMNIRFDILNKFYVGASFRSSDAVVSFIGLKLNQFRFGYSYDFTMSALKSYSRGSHELMLGYDLGKKKASQSSI